MKKAFFLLIVFISLTGINAQEITVEKVFGGYKFSRNGEKLSQKDVMEILKMNTQTAELAQAAQTNFTVGNILGFAGGFLVGWPLGSAIRGDEPNWTLAAVGAGLIGLSIPFTSAGNKKLKKALDLYNKSFQKSSYKFRPQYSISTNGNGIALVISF